MSCIVTRSTLPKRAAVFAPSPILTITVEDDDPKIHLHAGGQGFWFARMITALGVDVTLCGSFGGEAGLVVRTLIESENVQVRAVDVSTRNGAYIHDRRTGSRRTLAESTPNRLSRHEIDELYGAMVVEGLEADVCVLGSTTAAGEVVSADTYRRLASDLTGNGRLVVADLSGDALIAAIRGGTTVVKVSDEELAAAGYARSVDRDDVVAAIEKLSTAGPRAVIVSRAAQPALALLDGRIVEVVSPNLEPVEERGAGDSMTAGIAAALASGRDLGEAVRLGAAAGALNVARRGLGTGRRLEIERLAGHVELRALDRARSTSVPTMTPDELAMQVRPK